MNVLITSGGTRERVDAVRSITNTSTGALGALIAERFAASAATDTIFYVAGPHAKTPRTPKARIVPVGDTASVETALRELLAQHPVHAIIHAMAVSDFRVAKVTSARRLGEALLYQEGGSLPFDMLDRAEEFDRDGKIGSHLAGDKLIVVLEENPKIIGLLRELAPRALLTGFKLLDNVDEALLIDTAYTLLKENRCDFVLANDARDIHGDSHIGFLIDSEKKTTRWGTKAAIAEGMAQTLLQRMVV
jgi:phosphopantothenate-cysteine ligase